MSDTISCMVWNSERVLQAHCIAGARECDTITAVLPAVNGAYPPNLVVDQTTGSKFLTDDDRKFVREARGHRATFIRRHFALIRTQVVYTLGRLPVIQTEAPSIGTLALVDASTDPLSEVEITVDPLPESEIPMSTGAISAAARSAPKGASLAFTRLTGKARPATYEEWGGILLDWIKGGVEKKNMLSIKPDDGLKDDAALSDWIGYFKEVQKLVYPAMAEMEWDPDNPQAVNLPREEKIKLIESGKVKTIISEHEARTADTLATKLQLKQSDLEKFKNKNDASFFTQFIIENRIGRIDTLITETENRYKGREIAHLESTYLPRWGEFPRKAYLQSLAIGMALGRGVLEGAQPKLVSVPGWASSTIEQKERDATLKLLKKCAKVVEVDPSPSASMRLGELCAVFLELGMR